jgi:hypothetical protein
MNRWVDGVRMEGVWIETPATNEKKSNEVCSFHEAVKSPRVRLLYGIYRVGASSNHVIPRNPCQLNDAPDSARMRFYMHSLYPPCQTLFSTELGACSWTSVSKTNKGPHKQVQMRRIKAGFSHFKRLYCDLGGSPQGNKAAQEKVFF